MRRAALAAVVLLAAAVLATAPPSAAESVGANAPVAQGPSAAKAATHHVSISGTGVDMYPAFTAGIGRYAVLTTSDTGGAVDVTATTTDPAGRVWVDGRVARSDTTQVTGLDEGDEISVLIMDSLGVSRYWLIYLPAGFPRIETVTKKPGIAPGLVALTLSQWSTPTPNFDVAVDGNGVPAHVRSTNELTMDLKRQPNGNYSASRPTTTPGRTGQALVELDPSFKEIARYETVGLKNTDGHDSILRPDGSRILLAYEANTETGLTDSVIQEVDADGDVVFEWNSGDAGLADETVAAAGDPDYAHINSVRVMANGDWLASFRHLSAVLRIARTAHDGFAAGDIVWRLGGKESDFTFVNDPYPGGPCAQHTASQLPNGHIMVYDNGSGGFGNAGMCIDASNPSVPIARTQTRVSEYALDEDAGTATLVWSYAPAGRYGLFAGSASRLGNGNTLVGWTAVRSALASEIAPDGETLWEIRVPVPEAAPLYSSYRAAKVSVPDVVKPKVTVQRPAAGATYEFGQRVTLDLTCTDRGGSGLRACTGPGGAQSGDRLDTSRPGRHVVELTARDADGNSTTVRRAYVVGPMPYRPDASIRDGGRWVGDDVYGASATQDIRSGTTSRVTAVVRLQNDGAKSDRLRIRATAGSKKLDVRYLVAGKDVTKKLTNGTYRTAVLAPGKHVTLRIQVARQPSAGPGDSRRFQVTATSTHDGRVRDAVATTVRVERR